MTETLARLFHTPPTSLSFMKLKALPARMLALLLMGLGLWLCGWIIANNVTRLTVQQSHYQENLNVMIGQLNQYLRHWDVPDVVYFQEQLRQALNWTSIVSIIVRGLGDFASNLFSVILFSTFLLLEVTNFRVKFNKIANLLNANKHLNSSLNHISNLMSRFIITKIITSFLAGFLCYLVMLGFDLDLAAFWGLLIFLLNFIPYVGAVIAVVFPVIFALIQFQSWLVTGLLLGLLGLVLTLVGNILEPKLLGRSLNLSPLMILLGLALFGSIWGFVGMFLSVPLSVLALVICAQFESTRPIAILISDDGDIEGLYN